MKSLFLLPLFFYANFVFAYNEITLSLPELTAQAIEHSDKLKSLHQQSDGIEYKRKTIRSFALPQFNIEGNYKYTADIPTMTIPIPTLTGTTNREIQTGKHNAYFMGVSASYLLTDFGSNSLNQDATSKTKNAKDLEKVGMEQTLKLQVKNTYFKVMLDIEKMRLVLDSWRLSIAQHTEISKSYKAGTVGQIDFLQSRKESLDYKARFIQAQSDLSSDLSELMRLCNQSFAQESIMFPIEKQMLQNLPSDLERPQTLITIDQNSYKKFNLDKLLNDSWTIDNPELKRLSLLREGQTLAKQSVTRSLLPKVSVFAKSGYEYPDGSKSEFHRQSVIGVNLTMPIWDGGMIMASRGEKQSAINEISFEEVHLKKNFSLDLSNTLNNLKDLHREHSIIESGLGDVDQMSKLVYRSYQAGRSTITDVLATNLKALDWKVRLANIQTQILMQTAILEYLSSRTIL